MVIKVKRFLHPLVRKFSILLDVSVFLYVTSSSLFEYRGFR